MGVAEGLLFFTNDFGFAGLTYASEDFSMLYVTKDGGETFERLELPLDTVTELPSEAEELGFTIEDYDRGRKNGDLSADRRNGTAGDYFSVCG